MTGGIRAERRCGAADNGHVTLAWCLSCWGSAELGRRSYPSSKQGEGDGDGVAGLDDEALPVTSPDWYKTKSDCLAGGAAKEICPAPCGAGPLLVMNWASLLLVNTSMPLHRTRSRSS
jgi:hypothetical protein